jgi:hypothetical protein
LQKDTVAPMRINKGRGKINVTQIKPGFALENLKVG